MATTWPTRITGSCTSLHSKCVFHVWSTSFFLGLSFPNPCKVNLYLHPLCVSSSRLPSTQRQVIQHNRKRAGWKTLSGTSYQRFRGRWPLNLWHQIFCCCLNEKKKRRRKRWGERWKKQKMFPNMELESKISFMTHIKESDSNNSRKNCQRNSDITAATADRLKFLWSIKAVLSSTRKSPRGILQNVPKKINHYITISSLKAAESSSDMFSCPYCV